MENAEEVTQNGQSIETGNTGHTRQRKKTKTKTKKTPTQCALDTTICKQAHITLTRHEPSYKQLQVKTNRTSFDNYAFVYLFLIIQNGYAYRFCDISICQKYHTEWAL